MVAEGERLNVNSLGGEQRMVLTIERNSEQSGVSLPFASGEICVQHRALAYRPCRLDADR